MKRGDLRSPFLFFPFRDARTKRAPASVCLTLTSVVVGLSVAFSLADEILERLVAFNGSAANAGTPSRMNVSA